MKSNPNINMSLTQTETHDADTNGPQLLIKKAVLEGFPSLVILRFIGQVDWNLNGVWVRDLELKVTPPYASPDTDNLEKTVTELWEYALRPLDTIEPVPYENLACCEPAVEIAKELIEKLKASVSANPYLSEHRMESKGVAVSAELLFKP